ncbi:TetR family transcriptional regulator [Nakamurella sp.]|uniref:TetR/AcrR family transcriptional regulator n=1 Tax=Nakamurella sp. TaxID=1869182 RepID=UPI003B3B144C
MTAGPDARRRPARTGRRPGNPDTRRAILDAARATFAESGLDGSSIRRIAGRAGVDPALVHHYFGTKDDLFMATIELPIDLPALLQRVGADGPDGLGERLVTMILTVWESPAGAGLAGWLRTALADEGRARLLRQFVVASVAAPFAAAVGIPEAERERRIGLVMTQVVGLIVGRYLLALEPVAALPPGQVVASVGGTVQRYLTGPLPVPPDPAPGPRRPAAPHVAPDPASAPDPADAAG